MAINWQFFGVDDSFLFLKFQNHKTSHISKSDHFRGRRPKNSESRGRKTYNTMWKSNGRSKKNLDIEANYRQNWPSEWYHV